MAFTQDMAVVSTEAEGGGEDARFRTLLWGWEEQCVLAEHGPRIDGGAAVSNRDQYRLADARTAPQHTPDTSSSAWVTTLPLHDTENTL
jgi:hypothetical protein